MTMGVLATGTTAAHAQTRSSLYSRAAQFQRGNFAAFAGDPAHVEELYRAPDLHAALYFAFFMVTDPPTSRLETFPPMLSHRP